MSDGDEAQALVRTPGSDKAISARLGDKIAGWTVTQIEPRRVVLSIEDRFVSFALFAGANGKGTASQGPPPSSPDNEAPSPNAAIDARSPATSTGIANSRAVQRQYGPDFGRSAIQSRPQQTLTNPSEVLR